MTEDDHNEKGKKEIKWMKEDENWGKLMKKDVYRIRVILRILLFVLKITKLFLNITNKFAVWQDLQKGRKICCEICFTSILPLVNIF